MYNSTYHESIKYTPCEIMYGEGTELTFDESLFGSEMIRRNVEQIRNEVRKNLQKAGEQRRAKFNQRYRLIQFQIGDLVKIRKLNKSDAKQKIIKKFEPLYEGPYVVGSIPNANVYVLLEPNTNRIRGKYNAIHLSKYYQRLDVTDGLNLG